jgi:hypothetical protein
MDAGSLSALPVIETEFRADRVVVSGSSVFVTRPGALDSSVVYAPDAVGQVSSFEGLPGSTHPMAVSEGRLVVAGDGLVVLDVRGPAEPLVLAVDEHHYGGGMALRGGRAYVAAGDRGLVVLDLGRRAKGTSLWLPFALKSGLPGGP